MNCSALHMRPLPSRGLPFDIRRKIPYGGPAALCPRPARVRYKAEKNITRAVSKKNTRKEYPSG